MPLLGPDGTPIPQVSPIVKAVLQMLGDAGAAEAAAMATPYRLQNGHTVVVHLAHAAWAPTTQNPGGYLNVVAGRSPEECLLRLATEIVDHSKCMNCGRPALFDDDLETPLAGRAIDDTDPYCSMFYDPVEEAFVRACTVKYGEGPAENGDGHVPLP